MENQEQTWGCAFPFRSIKESFVLEKTFEIVKSRPTWFLLTLSWCFFHKGRFPEASVWPGKSFLPGCPNSSFSKQEKALDAHPAPPGQELGLGIPLPHQGSGPQPMPKRRNWLISCF